MAVTNSPKFAMVTTPKTVCHYVTGTTAGALLQPLLIPGHRLQKQPCSALEAEEKIRRVGRSSHNAA